MIIMVTNDEIVLKSIVINIHECSCCVCHKISPPPLLETVPCE